jgi:hypothetical protein
MKDGRLIGLLTEEGRKSWTRKVEGDLGELEFKGTAVYTSPYSSVTVEYDLSGRPIIVFSLKECFDTMRIKAAPLSDSDVSELFTLKVVEPLKVKVKAGFEMVDEKCAVEAISGSQSIGVIFSTEASVEFSGYVEIIDGITRSLDKRAIGILERMASHSGMSLEDNIRDFARGKLGKIFHDEEEE